MKEIHKAQEKQAKEEEKLAKKLAKEASKIKDDSSSDSSSLIVVPVVKQVPLVAVPKPVETKVVAKTRPRNDPPPDDIQLSVSLGSRNDPPSEDINNSFPSVDSSSEDINDSFPSVDSLSEDINNSFPSSVDSSAPANVTKPENNATEPVEPQSIDSITSESIVDQDEGATQVNVQETEESLSFSSASIIGIIGAAVAVLAVGVFAIVQRRQTMLDDEEAWGNEKSIVEAEAAEIENDFQFNMDMRDSSEYSM